MLASVTSPFEEGVFNASDGPNVERGPTSYNGMGHGDSEDYAVMVAAREALQNSFDAGATQVCVTYFAFDNSSCMLVFRDNAPAETRLSMSVYRIFMQMDKSSKPGDGAQAAGGKGQARAFFAGLDGLAMCGGDGFAAFVGKKYSAARDRAQPIVAHRMMEQAPRERLAELLARLPAVPDGGLVALRIGTMRRDTVEHVRRLAYYLALCQLPGVRLEYAPQAGATPCAIPLPNDAVPEPLAPPRTLSRLAHPGKLEYTLTVSHQAKTYPYGRYINSRGMLMHFFNSGLLMYSRFIPVQDICNSDNLQVRVDLRAESSSRDGILKNSELFTLPRSDLKTSRLSGLSCTDIARAAVNEFEGLLNRPTKHLVSAATKGMPLLAGVPSYIMDFLRIAKTSKFWEDQVASSEADLRSLTQRDRLDPSSKRTRLEAELEGAGYRVEVLVHDTGKGVYDRLAPPVPDALETTLIRYCALVSTVAVGVRSQRTGTECRSPVVGALYTDEESQGMSSGPVVYIEVRKRLALFLDKPYHHLLMALHELLNDLAVTTIHEVCHALVDHSQNHSRVFWDAHVMLLGSLYVRRCLNYLLRVFTPKAAELHTFATGLDFIRHIERVLTAPTDAPAIVVDSDDDENDPEWPPRQVRRRRCCAAPKARPPLEKRSMPELHPGV